MKAIYSLLLLTMSCILLISITGFQTSNTVKDYDGNIYNTVTIGKQIWMAENLKTTHYRNGDPINIAKDDNQWFNNNHEGAYCSYNNDTNNAIKFGWLYNSYAITDSRGICPAGWHIPTHSEWEILETYLGGNSVAGGKMKEAGTTHWVSPNIGATNVSGFSALPGGLRFSTGQFGGIGFTGYFWSSGWKSLDGTDAPWLRLVNYSDKSINQVDYSEANGFSVRCLKD